MAPGDLVGPYSVTRILASGGQGVVAEASHTLSGQAVALKVLLRPESAVVRARFAQEAQVLARLEHPGVVRVHACGEHRGAPYLALELVDGVDLKTRLSQGIPPVAWSAELVARLADAVEHCHQRGVVHRDLKPANVLLAEPDERPVLVDFGLVQRDPQRLGLTSLDARTRLTASEAAPGTPPYMAPEQIDAEDFGPVGPRSDVYGLGATLYALLTGEPPFQGATVLNTLAHVLRHAPPDPRARNPAVPDDLAQLCLRCLAKHPRDRPSSAAAVAAALRGEGPLAGPLLDHATRRRLSWVLVPAGVLLLGALAVGTVWRGPAAPAPGPAASSPAASRSPAIASAPSVPAWFQPGPDAPPLPLPAPVAFGSGLDQPYVNTIDGSALAWVAPGVYPLGAGDDFSNGPHEARLEGFFVGLHEVSRAQYAAFCQATGAELPSGVVGSRTSPDDDDESWRQPKVFEPGPEHPIAAVTLDDVLAYCAWAQADLPTGDEWEAAARGRDGRPYPWGAAPPGSDTHLANLHTPKDPVGLHYLAPVRSSYHQAGASPAGCLHMAGNVAELTRDPGAAPEVLTRGGHADRANHGDLKVTDRTAHRLPDHYVGFRIVVRP